ncbi:hypothetical protein Tsubulata_037332 [Turnera subulata]|uniref:Cystatin domain-containing protein n=1 Tax=Turnera subulata TaxID=218843 RepID=A0A9Q0JJN8_9ROSI|nr:hypothetical protein Tsubulata_037332 [Turnera subulata]
MASCFLLLFSLFLLAATAAYGDRQWEPISTRDPLVREMAEFAVYAYHPGLKLVSILKAEREIVPGHNYRLRLTAKDSKVRRAPPKKYVADVYENGQHNFTLRSFTPIP